MFFVKMQGLGNDYIYVAADHVPDNAPELSIRLSDRHFGIGGDGMIWICPPDEINTADEADGADFSMRIFNADGSEAKMCGNGIRCVGKYIYDYGLSHKTELRIRTLSGLRSLQLHLKEGKTDSVTVDMGTAELGVPVKYVLPDGIEAEGIPVSTGNPHLVFLLPEEIALTQERLVQWGSFFQHHPDFPEGVNVELCHHKGESDLRMRVYERGSAVTMACGTGACASAAALHKAAFQEGKQRKDGTVQVELDGGKLLIEVKPGKDEKHLQIMMTGPARISFEGQVDPGE